MPQSRRLQIWEPFVSGQGSTGLGLFVVQRQSEAMGGCCGMRDNAGCEVGGSTFWFMVPYVTSAEGGCRSPALTPSATNARAQGHSVGCTMHVAFGELGHGLNGGGEEGDLV